MIPVHPSAVQVAAAETPVLPRLLLVEPQPAARAALLGATRSVARVVARTDFPTARECLENASPDFVVTNVRLGVYNGLHLVYLAAARGIRASSIVYTERPEIGLAREVHYAGAFYDTREHLRMTLVAYVRGNLPPRDRRDALEDRRTMFRGGRRCWDHHIATVPSLIEVDVHCAGDRT